MKLTDLCQTGTNTLTHIEKSRYAINMNAVIVTIIQYFTQTHSKCILDFMNFIRLCCIDPEKGNSFVAAEQGQNKYI